MFGLDTMHKHSLSHSSSAVWKIAIKSTRRKNRKLASISFTIQNKIISFSPTLNSIYSTFPPKLEHIGRQPKEDGCCYRLSTVNVSNSYSLTGTLLSAYRRKPASGDVLTILDMENVAHARKIPLSANRGFQHKRQPQSIRSNDNSLRATRKHEIYARATTSSPIETPPLRFWTGAGDSPLRRAS